MHPKPLPTTEPPPSRNDIPLCTDDPLPPGLLPVPPGILRSLTAFRRDLPELMKSHYGQLVVYHGDRRLKFGRSERQLVQECLRQGLKRDEFVVMPVMHELPYDDEA